MEMINLSQRLLDQPKRAKALLQLALVISIPLVTQAEETKIPKSYERFEILAAGGEKDSRDPAWVPSKGIPMEVSGMEWIEDKLAVCIRKGEIWMLENPLSTDRNKINFKLFASGLHEPLGLLKDGEDLLVAQRGEVTRLRDSNNNGEADAYLTECDGWNVSGNYHAYAYGPARDGNGNLWVSLNLGMGKLANNHIGWRGWAGTIGKDGSFQPKALGMRSPSGMGANLKGDLFFSDQQGTWIPATPIYHLRPGVFYGNQESLASLKSPEAPFEMKVIPKPNQDYGEALTSSERFVPPAVWLPYNKMGRSATDVQVIDQAGKFGPFDGQFLIGEFTNSAVNRVFLEEVDGQYQGACFPFLNDFPAAVLRLQFAPDGSLFVGMSNRGWSSLGNRSYGLQRITFNQKTPFAIKEMKAQPEGFELVFTEPLHPDSLTPESFKVSSFTYQYSSRYGGDEINPARHKISGIKTSKDGRSIRFKVENLRTNYVFELTTQGLKSKLGQRLKHPQAWYTLNRIPNK